LRAASAGFAFCVLNALMRLLSLQVHPFQAPFLRCFFGLLVLLPFVWRHGTAAYRPTRVGGPVARGAFHTIGLSL
jgi:hypothetical protein